MPLQQIATQKMNQAQLQKTVDLINSQIVHKIEINGDAPEYLYNRLETYTFIFVNRFNVLPK